MPNKYESADRKIPLKIARLISTKEILEKFPINEWIMTDRIMYPCSFPSAVLLTYQCKETGDKRAYFLTVAEAQVLGEALMASATKAEKIGRELGISL